MPFTNFPRASTFHKSSSRFDTRIVGQPTEWFPAPSKEYLDCTIVSLSESQPLDTSLSDLVRNRYSCRRFSSLAIQASALSTILWAAYGVAQKTIYLDVEMLLRTVPSAGGLYPLEVYCLIYNVEGIEPGIYHYVPLYNALERIADLVPRDEAILSFLRQDAVMTSAAVLVVTAVSDRVMEKYGERGYRFILIEAGHLAQNANLAAQASGLGSLNLGGFSDAELSEILSLDSEIEFPVYAIAIGVPATTTPATSRFPPPTDLEKNPD